MASNHKIRLSNGQKIRISISIFIDVILIVFAILQLLEGDILRFLIYGLVTGYFVYRDAKLLRHLWIIWQKTKQSEPRTEISPDKIGWKDHPRFKPYINPFFKGSIRWSDDPVLHSISSPGNQQSKLELIGTVSDPILLKQIYFQSNNERIRSQVLRQIQDDEFLLNVMINDPTANRNIRSVIVNQIQDQQILRDMMDVKLLDVKKMIAFRISDELIAYELLSDIFHGRRTEIATHTGNMIKAVSDPHLIKELIEMWLVTLIEKKHQINTPYEWLNSLEDDYNVELFEKLRVNNFYGDHGRVLGMARVLLMNLPYDQVKPYFNELLNWQSEPRNQLIMSAIRRKEDKLDSLEREKVLQRVARDPKFDREITTNLLALLSERDESLLKELVEDSKNPYLKGAFDYISDQQFLRKLFYSNPPVIVPYQEKLFDKIEFTREELLEFFNNLSSELQEHRENDAKQIQAGPAVMTFSEGNRGNLVNRFTKVVRKLNDPQINLQVMHNRLYPAKIRVDLIKEYASDEVAWELMINELDHVDEEVQDNFFVMKKQGEDVIEIPIRQYQGIGESVATRYSSPDSVRMIKELLYLVDSPAKLNELMKRINYGQTFKDLDGDLKPLAQRLVDGWSDSDLENEMANPENQHLLPVLVQVAVNRLRSLIWKEAEKFGGTSNSEFFRELNDKQRFSMYFDEIQHPGFSDQFLFRLAQAVQKWEDVRLIFPFVPSQEQVLELYDLSAETIGQNLERKTLAIRNMDYDAHREFLQSIIFSKAPYVIRNEAVKRLGDRGLMIDVIMLEDEPVAKEKGNKFVQRYDCRCHDHLFSETSIDIRKTAVRILASDGDFDMLRDLQSQVEPEIGQFIQTVFD